MGCGWILWSETKWSWGRCNHRHPIIRHIAKTSRPLQAWMMIIANTCKSNIWNLGWIPLASGAHSSFCPLNTHHLSTSFFMLKTLLRACNYAYPHWVSHFRSVNELHSPDVLFSPFLVIFYLSSPTSLPHHSVKESRTFRQRVVLRIPQPVCWK